MIDKDHGILPDTSVEGPPFDTLNRAVVRILYEPCSGYCLILLDGLLLHLHDIWRNRPISNGQMDVGVALPGRSFSFAHSCISRE